MGGRWSLRDWRKSPPAEVIWRHIVEVPRHQQVWDHAHFWDAMLGLGIGSLNGSRTTESGVVAQYSRRWPVTHVHYRVAHLWRLSYGHWTSSVWEESNSCFHSSMVLYGLSHFCLNSDSTHGSWWLIGTLPSLLPRPYLLREKDWSCSFSGRKPWRRLSEPGGACPDSFLWKTNELFPSLSLLVSSHFLNTSFQISNKMLAFKNEITQPKKPIWWVLLWVLSLQRANVLPPLLGILPVLSVCAQWDPKPGLSPKLPGWREIPGLCERKWGHVEGEFWRKITCSGENFLLSKVWTRLACLLLHWVLLLCCSVSEPGCSLPDTRTPGKRAFCSPPVVCLLPYAPAWDQGLPVQLLFLSTQHTALCITWHSHSNVTSGHEWCAGVPAQQGRVLW